MAATSRVSRMAAAASGSVMAREIGAEPGAERLDEDRGERQQQKQNEKDAPRRRSRHARTGRRLGGDGRGRACR